MNKKITCSMLPKLSYLVLILLGGFLGCSKQTPTEVVLDWEEKGWARVSVHGEVGPSQRNSKLSSTQAKAVEASWVERGRRKTKVYSQKTHYHMVLRFFKEDVVLKKKK